MAGAGDFLEQVRGAAGKRLLFLPHAVARMLQPDRMIDVREVHEVVETGDIIEDYPEDSRGHSCLMMARCATGRVVHVVCSPKADYLAIISAYVPSPARWHTDYRTRR